MFYSEKTFPELRTMSFARVTAAFAREQWVNVSQQEAFARTQAANVTAQSVNVTA